MTHYSRNLIDDKPTSEDAFSGGGHQRVARSLARTIIDLDSRDAVIGLDGGWGSGKSSVIEMAQSKLSDIDKDKKFYLMTFDLWANQSLFFRRAFLEQFISWALDEKDLSGKKTTKHYLEKTAKLIGGREQIVETSTKAHFNLLGAIFVLMLPLLPIIYAWMSPFAIKPTPVPACVPNCPNLTTFQHWLISHGSEVSLSVIGILFLFALGKFANLWWKSGSSIESLKQLAGLVERKTENNMERKLIRDVDPSNTEFSETFRELLSRLQTNDKRIVIVFDNVDRLSNSHASVAWSDMQAVLLRHSTPTMNQVLTAVIPYDREVISQAMFGLNGSSTPPTDPQDLFRKSFDAIHHVSPPVISDIDFFVKRQLTEALGSQIEDDTSKRVAHIFDLFEGVKHKTPRQVTAFVNEIATLWVEWEGEIPLDAVAVFVSNRPAIEDERTDSSIGSVSRGPFGYRVKCSTTELEEYLAMLSFSAPKELAMQVALFKPIRRSLVLRSSTSLKELSQSAAFPMMLGRVLDENTMDIASDLNGFENAIGNLEVLDTENDFIEAAILKLSEVLPNLTPSDDPDEIADYGNVLSLPALLSENHLSKVTSDLSEWVFRAFPTASADRQESHGKNWIQAISQIRDAVIQCTDAPEKWLEVQKAIPLPSGQSFIYGAASEADDHDLKLAEFNTRGRYFSQGDYLISKLDKPDANILRPFAQISESMSELLVEPVMSKLVEVLNTRSSSDLKDIKTLQTLLSLYPILAKRLLRKTVKKHSDALCKNGAVFACLERIAAEDDGWLTENFAELCIYLLDKLRFDVPALNTSQYQNHPQLGNISHGISWFNNSILNGTHNQETIEKLANAAKRLELDFQFIYFAGQPDEGTENPELYPKLASALLSMGSEIFLSDSDFIDCFPSLVSLNIEGALAYGTAKDEKKNSWKDIIPLEIETEVIDTISDAQGQYWPNLLGKIDVALSSRTSTEWQKDLAEDSEVLWVLENRLDHGSLKFPTAQIKKPILDHLLGVATTDQSPAKELSRLLDAFTSSSIKSLRRDFLESLDNKPVEGVNLHRLLVISEEFLPKLDYCALPNISFNKILMPLLDVPDEFVGKLILDNANSFAEVIKVLGESASQQISEVLSTMNETEGFDKTKVSQSLGVVEFKSDKTAPIDDSE